MDGRQKKRAFSELKAADVSMEARIWFMKEHPRHDARAVVKAFKAFVKKGNIRPTDADALFKSYATKWVQGEE